MTINIASHWLHTHTSLLKVEISHPDKVIRQFLEPEFYYRWFTSLVTKKSSWIWFTFITTGCKESQVSWSKRQHVDADLLYQQVTPPPLWSFPLLEHPCFDRTVLFSMVAGNELFYTRWGKAKKTFLESVRISDLLSSSVTTLQIFPKPFQPLLGPLLPWPATSLFRRFCHLSCCRC